MQLKEFIATHAAPIRRGLTKALTETARRYQKVTVYSQDLQKRLLPLASAGKLVRGNLVLLGYLAAKPKGDVRAVLPAAVAVELLQTALLVHDDVMDRDDVRRGQPSLHAQYRTSGAASAEYGAESLAVCLGDVTFFTAMRTLASCGVPAQRLAGATALVTAEMETVGLAQMQDVAWGGSNAEPEPEAVLGMYKNKTARYSFSLPLMLGATLGGGSAQLCKSLEQYGESVGVLYQLRDDELGLSGAESVLGKPVGSDLKEKKKTYYRALVVALGKDLPAETEAAVLVLEQSGVLASVRKTMQSCASRAMKQLQKPGVPAVTRTVLGELISYAGERTR